MLHRRLARMAAHARIAPGLCAAGVGWHAPPPWQPDALPAARHGHRVEALPDGLLAFGGFTADDDSEGRGMRDCLFLPRAPQDGAAAWQRREKMHQPRAFFASAVVDGAV